MKKRTLQELNLIDNFLFGTVMENPTFGEAFSRILLEVILQRKVGNLSVRAQSHYIGQTPELHGAVLDVMIEEEMAALPDGNGERHLNIDMTALPTNTVYDLEPQCYRQKNAHIILPRRLRFYHSVINADHLKAGSDYHAMKNVTAIMITPFDPFGQGRMVYTFKNTCIEEPSVPYEDGARTIYLYTRGAADETQQELKQLLYYMEHTCEANACTEALAKIQKMVDQIKGDAKEAKRYMRLMPDAECLIEHGFDLGFDQGFERGRAFERANAERERQRAVAAERQLLMRENEI